MPITNALTAGILLWKKFTVFLNSCIRFAATVVTFAAGYALKPPYYNIYADSKGGGGVEKGGSPPSSPPPPPPFLVHHSSRQPNKLLYSSSASSVIYIYRLQCILGLISGKVQKELVRVSEQYTSNDEPGNCTPKEPRISVFRLWRIWYALYRYFTECSVPDHSPSLLLTTSSQLLKCARYRPWVVLRLKRFRFTVHLVVWQHKKVSTPMLFYMGDKEIEW